MRGNEAGKIPGQPIKNRAPYALLYYGIKILVVDISQSKVITQM